jgi:hypothetical protein
MVWETIWMVKDIIGKWPGVQDHVMLFTLLEMASSSVEQ